MPDGQQHHGIAITLDSGAAVAGFAAGCRWITLTGGGLPYPVAVSVAVGTGGRLRCTGLVLGADASGGSEAVEITSASLRKIRITELLQATSDEAAALFSPRTVTAAELAELAGPGYDPADFRTLDGGRTYRLPPAMSYSGTRKSRPPLDQLVPGLAPDLPPAGPRIRGQALPPAHFEMVAAEYRLALESRPQAPMQQLIRRLEDWKGYPVPEPTARRWVQRARDMGLLGPSRPGVAGEYPQDPLSQEAGGFLRQREERPAPGSAPDAPDPA